MDVVQQSTIVRNRFAVVCFALLVGAHINQAIYYILRVWLLGDDACLWPAAFFVSAIGNYTELAGEHLPMSTVLPTRSTAKKRRLALALCLL